MLLRAAVRGLVRSSGLELKKFSAFARAVDLLAAREPRPYFVQVGANNGTDFDDMYAAVVRNDLPGIAVEPVGDYFRALTFAYARHPQVRPVRVALHPTASQLPMYRVDPAQATQKWHHGLASFSREHLLRHGLPPEAVVEELVPALTFNELLLAHMPTGTKLGILAVDTEGFDAEILDMMDMARHRPAIVRFEAKHLPTERIDELCSKLSDHGYQIRHTDEDCLAVRGSLVSRLAYARRAATLGQRR